MKHLLIITLSLIFVSICNGEDMNSPFNDNENDLLKFKPVFTKKKIKPPPPPPPIKIQSEETSGSIGANGARGATGAESGSMGSQGSTGASGKDSNLQLNTDSNKPTWMKLNLADTILAFDNLNKLFVAGAGSETEFKNLQGKCTKFTEMRKDLANLKNKEYKSVFDVLGGKTENCFADTEEQLTIACNGVLTKKLNSKKEDTASTPLTYIEFKDDIRLQRELKIAAINYQGRFKYYKLKRKGKNVDCSDTGDIMGAPYDDGSVSKQEESNK